MNTDTARPVAGQDGGAVVALPALSDNYIWLVRQGDDAVVVDPGQAGPVLQALSRDGLRLRAILLTHHHNDHVGGVVELVQATGAVVYGPAREALPHCDHRLAEGDRVSLAQPALDLQVLDVPGHTAGHIAYHGLAAGQPVLFCGDTLFAAGCGRLFEGTPAQMHDSLQKIARLPADLQVCCAHEYTLDNLHFALSVEPNNEALRARAAKVSALRAQGRCVVPSLLSEERATNPMLRWDSPELQEQLSRQSPGIDLTNPEAVFTATRKLKDSGAYKARAQP